MDYSRRSEIKLKAGISADIKAIDATFKASKEQIYMGESVSFIVENPAFGQMYEWSATGAETEKIYGLHGNIVDKLTRNGIYILNGRKHHLK